VAADEEALELLAAAAGDHARLEDLVARRCQGEPLAWLTGSVTFCGERIVVKPGVYVPRWQSEPLALEAANRLPTDGIAVDLCTGAGALAVVIMRRKPRAQVFATESDPTAVDCARANGVNVIFGDLTAGLVATLAGTVDVVCAVVPYVPTQEMHLLPRDVMTYEPRHALDGGPQGTEFLLRAIAEAAPLLRPRGWLLLEIGGAQGDALASAFEANGYDDVTLAYDDEGDLRAVSARRR
jgi:release factor glutamine methyltransferase